ncbi:MAG: hypothetical protein ACRDD2_07605 [Sarcina sp.]
MKVLFSGSGKKVNMHLMDISVKEAVALNKIYNDNKDRDIHKVTFKETISEYCKEENEVKEENKGNLENHNLDNYLLWRGNILKDIKNINYK